MGWFEAEKPSAEVPAHLAVLQARKASIRASQIEKRVDLDGKTLYLAPPESHVDISSAAFDVAESATLATGVQTTSEQSLVALRARKQAYRIALQILNPQLPHAAIVREVLPVIDYVTAEADPHDYTNTPGFPVLETRPRQSEPIALDYRNGPAPVSKVEVHQPSWQQQVMAAERRRIEAERATRLRAADTRREARVKRAIVLGVALLISAAAILIWRQY